MDDPILPFDVARMLLGDAPPLFLLEVLARTLIIYLYTLGMLRWVGGRSIAQLSIVEFLLVIALGSAVGDAMFYPDVPLLAALLVITVVVLIDKVVDLAIRRFRRAKSLIDGNPVEVMRDGCVVTEGLVSRHIGAMEVMEMLRLQGIENLGQVRRAYLEPSGELSVFQFDPPRPGLSIVPPPELEPPPPPAPGKPSCCVQCGFVFADLSDAPCDACAGTGRTAAQEV